MPNGGSDCCGTCWFNRTNKGKRDWVENRDRSVPPYCEIRNLAIKDPFYTYCANHPHRRPDRDPIPIGPVMRHGGWKGGFEEYPRTVWELSPDSEDIRQHLLSLLQSLYEQIRKDRYPLGIGLGETILWQLGEFGEQRAVEGLERIREQGEGFLHEAASEALAKIQGTHVENANVPAISDDSRIEARLVDLWAELGKWFRTPTGTPLPDVFIGKESIEDFEARKRREREEGTGSELE